MIRLLQNKHFEYSDITLNKCEENEDDGENDNDYGENKENEEQQQEEGKKRRLISMFSLNGKKACYLDKNAIRIHSKGHSNSFSMIFD